MEWNGMIDSNIFYIVIQVLYPTLRKLDEGLTNRDLNIHLKIKKALDTLDSMPGKYICTKR